MKLGKIEERKNVNYWIV